MTILQEWLDNKYPTPKKKEQLKKMVIDYSNQQKELDGQTLNLSNYPNLERIIISGIYLKSKLTKLELGENPKLIELNCSWNQLSDQNLTKINQLINKNWKNIHPDFTPLLQESWNKHNFTYKNIKELINKGFKPNDYDLINYLKRNNYNPEQELNLDALRKEQQNNLDWTDIHKDFGEKNHYKDDKNHGKTYQQIWEQQNLTYQDAQEWILVGLKPYNGYNFASHLKQNNITPEQYINYIKNKSSQEQLDYFYPNKTPVKEINLTNLKFNQPSGLIINNYPNLKETKGWNIPHLTNLTITNCPQLEEIDVHFLKNFQQLTLNNLSKLKKLICYNNNLTTLEINNCANLEYIDCQNNQLTQIKLPLGEKLEWLELQNNNLNQDLSFLSGLVNLKLLYLFNNPLAGSLEPLKEMSKLEKLYIYDTDIDSGLEYLPESVKSFWCSVDKRKDAKVKVIYNLFANEKGEVETDHNGWIKNFLPKLQACKQNPQVKTGIKEILNAGKIASEQLTKQLINDIHITNSSHTWEDYLEKSLTMDELNSRKEKILAAIENLKQIQELENQKQEELRKAEERRIITLLIPVEKMDTARREIKRFIENWNQDKLSKLKTPQQLSKYRWAVGTSQWTGRVASIVGGGLLLVGTQNNDNNYTTTGGVIAIVGPFVEIVTSQLEKSLYENNKDKWREFTQATDKLWDTYWELDDILKKINEDPIKGKVKEILGNLKKEISVFLEEYDADENNEIDEEEREIAKRKIAQDLKNKWAEKKKQLKGIEKITEKLCKEVISYRNDADETIKQAIKGENKKPKQVVINLDEHLEANQSLNSSQANLLNKSQENIELQNFEAKIQQTETYGTPGSSKNN